jgi:hypothetical protein
MIGRLKSLHMVDVARSFVGEARIVIIGDRAEFGAC